MTGIRRISGLKSALQGVLVIANSGRMLAHSVGLAGYSPLVIDLFSDQDTKAIAKQLWQVDDFSLAVVQEVVENLLLSYKIQWVIYGSGLESYPETLKYLADNFNVTGNDFIVFQQLSATKAFFKQLDEMEIRHPDVQFYPPTNRAGWLLKPINHAGGIGISWCSRIAKEDEYYQKFCQGDVGSALFCADGQQIDLIGFHRQWSINQDNFVFAGIIREDFLPEEAQQLVLSWIKKLVRYYHLKGLASLDFIWDGESCFFLEINPRPPASMMLYSELDLLTAHITGRLVAVAKENKVRAVQIVYAVKSCKIKQPQWPEWSFDRPKINTSIQAGEPICSIMAQEKSVQQTLNSLLEKQKIIENNLY